MRYLYNCKIVSLKRTFSEIGFTFQIFVISSLLTVKSLKTKLGDIKGGKKYASESGKWRMAVR